MFTQKSRQRSPTPAQVILLALCMLTLFVAGL